MALQKPGSIITPTSFAVAPELLGRPLASPSRRAVAMAVDLVLLGILVNAGALFFGFAAAFALWWASGRTEFGSSRPRLRKGLRLGAAAVLFLLVLANWGFWTRPLHRLLGERGSGSDHGVGVQLGPGPDGTVKLGLSQGLGSIADIVALRKADNSEDARRSADRLVQRLQEAGASAADLRRAQRELEQGSDENPALPPVAMQALREAVAATALATDSTPDSAQAGGAAADTVRPDSLARAYVRAATKHDSAALGTLRPRLGLTFAADTLASLGARVQRLDDENRQLRDHVRQDSARQAGGAVGLMDTFANASGELVRLLRKAGLGFGWLGLYFTGFVALMRGQTPGKRLLHIRIVRLDGRPMNWWSSLERFGGYAASVVTALGGFFEILWDRNRQAMHDKIAETVVIRV